MSTTIDQRVVQMQFDNKHFESNVQTTMSTLDKLKQKLNLNGASKGLENVNAAAKNVKLTGLTSAIQTVESRFSAMEVIGVTALANITNSAINAGKRMVSALTIDPVKTGLSEYETKINAIQVIKANTRGKNDMNDITSALEELNQYADRTIYNFTQMTDNVGKFVAQGLDVYEATNAIQGLANLAGASGASAQDMSRATYQMSQALGGVIRKIDWNSLRNANMATVELKNVLSDIARIRGIDIDGMIADKGTFEDTLEKGWLTGEMFTEAMNIYSDVYSEAELKAKGFSDEQVANFKELAQTAKEATTEVKTFSQLWDVLKETAQSGWTQTWELIIGDFDSAKKTLTALQNFCSDIINGWSNARNFVIEGVMNFAKPWTALSEKLGNVQKAVKSVTDVTDKLEHFQDVVTRVWRGDFNNHGDNPDRYDLLEKAGYDHRVVQTLVNKGYQYKITVEDIEEAHKKFGLTMETTTEETKAVTDALAGLDDETLRNAGLTEEEIRLYRDLEKNAEKYGMTIDELAKKMSETSGRDLLIDGLKNIGLAIVNVCKAIGGAWREIFEPISIVGAYMTLDRFHEWTKGLELVDQSTGELNETGQKIQRTFKGIFAIVDVLATILSGGFRIAFKIISGVLKYFGLGVLDVTAAVGDAAVAFRDWFDSLFDISGLIDKVGPGIKKLKEWFKSLAELPGVQHLISSFNKLVEGMAKLDVSPLSALVSGITFLFDIISTKIKELTGLDIGGFFSNIFSKIISAFESITGIDLPGEHIFSGLLIELKAGAKNVIEFIAEAAADLIDKFCEILGIHSPSTVFIAIGGFIIAGLISGIKQGLISVPEQFQAMFDKCIAIIQGIDWGTIMALGISVAGLVFLKKIGDALDNFSAPFAGIGAMLESLSDVGKSISTNFKMKALKQLAMAVAIMVGVVLLIVNFGGDDYLKMWNAVAIVGVLTGVLIGLSFALAKMSEASVSLTKGKLDFKTTMSNVLSIGLAVAAIAGVVVLLGKLDATEAKTGFARLAIIAGGMLAFIGIMRVLTTGDVSDNVSKVGGMMIKLGIALLIMVGVCKLLGMLSQRELERGIAFALALGIFMAILTRVARSAGNNVGKVGGMMIKVSLAMLLMIGVCKLASKLTAEDMLKGAAFAAGFALFMRAFIGILKCGKKTHVEQVGGMILSVALSMIVMVGVCKLAGMLTVDELKKGAAFTAGFGLLIIALVSILKCGNETQIAKVSATILAVAIAIGILAAVSMLLSLLTVEQLKKGLSAVSVLAIMMSIMIHSLKGAHNVYKSLIVMVVAIAVLSIAAAALTLIPDQKKLWSAVGSLSAMMIAFGIMVNSLKGVKNVPKSVIVSMAIMTAIVGGMAYIIYQLCKHMNNPDTAIKAAVSLSLLMVAMTGCLKILSAIAKTVTGGDLAKGIIALTAMAVPLAAFALVISKISVGEYAYTKLIALTTVMYAMSGLLAIVSTIGKISSISGLAKGIIGLVAMAVPLGVFALVISKISIGDYAYNNVICLTAVMYAMTLLLGVLTVIGAGLALAVQGIIGLTAMAVPLAVFALVISKISIGDYAYNNVICLTAVMFAMTILLGVLTVIGAGLPLALMGIIGLCAMIAPMLLFNWGLQQLGDLAAIKTNIDIMLGVMVAMTGLLTQLAIIAPLAIVGVVALAGLITLIGLVGAVVVAIGALDKLTNGGLGAVIDTGIPLLIRLAEGVGEMIGAFISSMLSEAMSVLPELGTNLSEFATNVQPFVTQIGQVGEDVIAGAGYLTAAILALTVADFVNGIASFGKGDFSLPLLGMQLSLFMTNAKGFLDAIGDIDESAVNSAKTLADMIMTLTAADLINSIASFIPGLGGVNFAQVGSMLTTFGTCMREFSNELTKDGGIDTEAINIACTAGELMIKFMNTLPKSGGIIQEIVGEADLAKFSVSCLTFGQCMKQFSDKINENGGIDKDAIQNAADAGISMNELLKALPKTGGLIQTICGEQDLVKLGTSSVAFAEAMIDFQRVVTEAGGIDKTMAQQAVDAGEIMLALQDALPRTGGFIQDICGEQDLTDFGVSLSVFGKAITDFCANTKIDETAVTTAKNAGLAMTELQNAIPEEKWFDGKVSLEDFGKKIVKFGEKFSEYSEEVSGVDSATVSSSITSAKRLVTLVKSLTDLDTSGIDNFKVKAIGSAMKEYNKKVEDIDASVVASSVNSARKLVSLIKSLVGIDTSGISSFNVKSIGDKMKAYSDAVSTINASAIANSISAANKLKNFINSLAGLNTSGVGSFKTAVENLGKTQVGNIEKVFTTAATNLSKVGANMIDGVTKGMKSRERSMISATTNMAKQMISNIRKTIPTFGMTGVTLMTKFASGIKSQSGKVKAAATTSLHTAVISMRGCYSSFYSAGSYLVDGFAAGISANSFKAAAKAAAMANAAEKAAKDALDINSPSKVFRKLGYSVPEGFAMGIDRLGGMVKDSAVGMTNIAVDGVKNSIARVAEAINSDMDTQPTIRPVLDLSDVRTGAAAVSGLFSNGATVGLMANVNSISSMMNGRIQNGMNDDVVSAINGLRSDLSNLGGDSVTVNGVTYDDGSNVSNAVKALVRGIRREGRV